MEETAEIFRLAQGHLLSFAMSILKNEEDAQDVVQEVFKECLEKSDTHISKPYLFKAVRNRSLNKMRAHKRLTSAVERFAEYLNLLGDPTTSRETTVMDFVENLPRKQREVLILRIKAELKISEIAEILGIPEGTVKSRLNKSLKYLRSTIVEV